MSADSMGGGGDADRAIGRRAMRFWWSTRPLRAERDEAGRSASRVSVSRAVAAARMAQAGVPVGLGSASVDVVMLRRMEAVERAAVSGPLPKAMRRAKRGLSPDLLWATARAAREAGRQPEEVWAEALRDWLATREPQSAVAGGVRLARGPEARRRALWGEIDDTLERLRAS